MLTAISKVNLGWAALDNFKIIQHTVIPLCVIKAVNHYSLLLGHIIFMGFKYL